MNNVHPRHTHPGAELLLVTKKIQDARNHTITRKHHVCSLLKQTHTGVTELGRASMRACKLGSNNPNYNGLSDMHKKKIAATMKKLRRGEHHHFYNMQHTPRSKLKISLGMRMLPKRKWMLDPEGREHYVYPPFHLPEGWCWGRRRRQ
jgi:hypothetical protein